MKVDHMTEPRIWTCWVCKRIFLKGWKDFQKHLDECEIKAIKNPEVYNEDTAV